MQRVWWCLTMVFGVCFCPSPGVGENTHIGCVFNSSVFILAKVRVETWEDIYCLLFSSVWVLGWVTLLNYFHLHGCGQLAVPCLMYGRACALLMMAGDWFAGKVLLELTLPRLTLLEVSVTEGGLGSSWVVPFQSVYLVPAKCQHHKECTSLGCAWPCLFSHVTFQ